MTKRLEDWLFYFFLFAIPISLRHIFWYQPFQFIEWTSIYVYATDLLLLVLFGFWFVNWKTDNSLVTGKWKLVTKPADYFLLAFVIVAGLSIRNAIDGQTAVFQWVKLIEGVALYFYIKNYALKRFNMTVGFTALVFGGLFQSTIAIGQFITQGSLGLRYLGESPLAAALDGIAAFYVNSVKIMRAYGTTPHANVLAAYLFIAIGSFYNIAIYQKRRWWWHIFHAVILWAFFLTFSRVILAVWLLTFIVRSLLIRFYPKFHQEFWKKTEEGRRGVKIFIVTIVVGLAFIAVYYPYVANRAVISGNDEAVQLRILYNQQSLAGGHNILGLGMGNFVPWLMTQNLHLNREIYQPVHNTYLLIYSETGIVGLALFLIFLALLWRDYYRRVGFNKLYPHTHTTDNSQLQGSRLMSVGVNHFSFAIIVGSLLVFGLFDHFLWTIQSGRLMFWLVLALLAGAE